MIPALLHGKLTKEQENMEDILTSSVFGVLRYLPPERGLLPFLRKSLEQDGQPFSLLDLNEVSCVDYSFWPSLELHSLEEGIQTKCHTCEPDILLRIRKLDGSRLNVLVEAKLWSGKSSGPSEDDDAPYDQLAREWDNLVCLSRKEDAEPLLIYLTADVGLPLEQIQESEREYLRKRPGRFFRCGWLSWRQISVVFHSTQDAALEDLVDLCKRFNLQYFAGIYLIEPEADLDWCFEREPRSSEWFGEPICEIDWSYTQ